MSLLNRDVPRDGFAELSCFRTEFYACMAERRDALFELGDALLCADGLVKTLVELSLAPEYRRGHGALYGGLNCGRLNVARLRRALAGLPLPRTAEGRLVLVSWTAMLDVLRLCPWDDEIAVTAVQVREVFKRLYVAGWRSARPGRCRCRL